MRILGTLTRPLVVCLALVACACGASDASPRTLSLPAAPADEIVHNPGKGWVAYGFRQDYGNSREDRATLGAADTGYHRFYWRDLVRQDGDGRVRLTPGPLDRFLDGWLGGSARRQVAFGVIAESTVECRTDEATPLTAPITPAYVFARGARSVPTALDRCPRDARGRVQQRRSPVWTDPVLLREYRRMLTLVREHLVRRGALDRVAFVDVRSYGNYGEGQTFDLNPRSCTGAAPAPGALDLGGDCVITPAQLQRHVDAARAVFPADGRNPRLVLPWGNRLLDGAGGAPSAYERAVRDGVGLRRDGLLGGATGNSTEPRQSTACPCTYNPLGSDLRRARGRVPAVFEFFDRGVWDRGRFEQALDLVRPTYSELGGAFRPGSPSVVADLLRRDGAGTLARLQRRLGFDLNLAGVRTPDRLAAGRTVRLPMRWTNDGDSRAFVRMRLGLALLGRGGEVRASSVGTGVDPRRFGPGSTEVDARARFDAPAGEYTLGVRLVDPRTGSPYRLATSRTPTGEGWYRLGRVDVR